MSVFKHCTLEKSYMTELIRCGYQLPRIPLLTREIGGNVLPIPNLLYKPIDSTNRLGELNKSVYPSPLNRTFIC